ncbi:hypothetical protein SLE2022_375600 [Rubroshorea leprosula]
MRAKDGKSRQFAFIGFRREHEAEEAIKYFNKSYLDTFRITCEIARKVGDPNAPHPWSQYSSKKQEKVIDVGNKTPVLKVPALLPRVKLKMWANDMTIAPSANQNDHVTEKERVAKKEGKKKSVFVDVEQNMEYFKSRVQKDWSDSESDDDASNSDAEIDNTNGDVGGKSDEFGDFLEESLGKDCKGMQDSLSKDVAEEGPSEDANDEILDPENPSSTLKDDKDGVLETGRLFVRNLPYTATEDELEDLFSKFGNVSQVHLVVNKDTKRSKGIAYVLTSRVCSKVVENIARKYGVSKSDFFDREADDLAVCIALGETQVIAATKRALANAGVNVSSLEEFAAGNPDIMKRSNHVLLVKNLPHGSSESELANMFGKLGSLDKINLPPSKTLALVVFLEPAEARAAFKGLAYKRYKDAPLYSW